MTTQLDHTDLFPSGHLNDLYNARVFKKMFEGELLWNKNAGGWFIHNEYWQLDTNDSIKTYAIQLVDEMKNHTKNWGKTEKGTEQDDMKQSWIRHVRNSGQSAKMASMLDCAKGLMAFEGVFDWDHWLLNCKNGTVNLKKGELYKHDPLNYCTKICKINYDPNAICPIWISFLNDIFMGNNTVIDYLQKVIGYSLTGMTNEQCFFILWGDGCNGKSTFIETIAYILNDYGMTCDSKTLMAKDGNQINNDVARLKGARFVSAGETNRYKEFDEAVIKRLTGNDKIIARFLNKENFEFYPTFKIFITTNHKPNIRSIDEGIWRRVRMIPFLLKIDNNKMDKFLVDKLKEEASGILAWAVQGCLGWQMEGLKEPELIHEAGKKYKMEEDRIGTFLSDECIIGEKCLISVPILKEKLWEYLGYKLGNKSIAEYMKIRGFNGGRTYLDGKQTRVYFGIGLREHYPEAEESETKKQVVSTIKEEDQIEWET